MNDAEIIDQVLNNNNISAFNHLITKYNQAVFSTSMGILHQVEDAQDNTQEVFVEVFNSLQKFRREANLSTWIYRITVNKAINLAKKNQRQQKFSLSNFFGKKNSSVEFSEPAHYDNATESEELSNIVTRAIDSLPDNQRIAFTLHKYDDLPYKEIAEIMQVSLSSVESLIHRAKQNLQKKLQSYYNSYQK